MAFLDSEVEDGSGLVTALVFEQSAEAVTWLSHPARALPAFAAAGEVDQDKALLKATNFALWLLAGRVDGWAATKGQALLYPRDGSSARNGRVFARDEIPPALLQSIRLLAEEEVASLAGLLRRTPDGLEHLASESSTGPGGTRTLAYRKGIGSLADRYPEQWELLQTLYDPSRRRETWAA